MKLKRSSNALVDTKNSSKRRNTWWPSCEWKTCICARNLQMRKKERKSTRPFFRIMIISICSNKLLLKLFCLCVKWFASSSGWWFHSRWRWCSLTDTRRFLDTVLNWRTRTWLTWWSGCCLTRFQEELWSADFPKIVAKTKFSLSLEKMWRLTKVMAYDRWKNFLIFLSRTWSDILITVSRTTFSSRQRR